MCENRCKIQSYLMACIEYENSDVDTLGLEWMCTKETNTVMKLNEKYQKKKQQQQRDDYKKHDTRKNSKRDGKRERETERVGKRGWKREKVKKNANMEWYRYENEELVYTTNAKLKME